jgi:uncharacterized membrane protein
MNSDDLTLEARVSRLELRLEAIAAKLGERPAGPPHRAAPPKPISYANPLATKSIEWWLARGGAVLTCLALVLLYQYAVERNWITPIVRVMAGMLVGAALLASARRMPGASVDASDDVVGLREVLLGAGLAAWYITAYAAAIYYQLIPLSAARMIFLALSIGGAWLALNEHRSVLGFLALGAGFMTPVLLPSPNPVVPIFALYLGTLAAVGLVLYLMRGWQSILWLTTISFWWSASRVIDLMCCEGRIPQRIAGSPMMARVSMSLLLIAAGAALLRTPLLRRRLVALGSPLYTEPRRSGFASFF